MIWVALTLLTIFLLAMEARMPALGLMSSMHTSSSAPRFKP